jgi:acyl-CoA thioesterase
VVDQERITALLAADPYAASLGVKLLAVDEESVTITMDITRQHTNFLGVAHGGAVFSLADCAFSLASNAPGDRAVAIDTHMVLSAPVVPGDELTAVVEEVHRGRTLATYRVIVRRADGRVAGHFTGTVLITS